MAGDSKIQWTQKTWNPVAGCSVLSPGCTNCYAMKQAARIEAMAAGAGRTSAYDGLTRKTKAGAVWTGEMRLVESALTQPLRWRQPAVIFVNSMSDLLHEDLPDAAIDKVFAVMALSPQHTFQVLTKRAERMQAYASDPATPGRIARAIVDMLIAGTVKVTDHWPVRSIGDIDDPDDITIAWPLPNVWKGVSAEDLARADERIPHLLATPAAVRFLSAEPLLGGIDLTAIPWRKNGMTGATVKTVNALTGEVKSLDPVFTVHNLDHPPRLDWVIVGGESGPGARPMHPDWARQLRDQCAAAGVPFFFKQWGAWTPGENAGPVRGPQTGAWLDDAGWSYSAFTRAGADGLTADDEPDVWRVGKRAAGRLLDGVEHNAMPESA